MTTRFTLSTRGRLSAVVSLAFVLADPACGADIEVAAGSDTRVTRAPSGAAVVDIAAPTAAGLSHNRFKEYGVDAAGAVLNNAVAGGHSTLAGEVAANAGLGGRAASVILNEVVGHNPSLLLGQQEVLGRAADYVLANPNGIQCQGCGFVNTPRATLLVGRPEVEDGRLARLVTAGQGELTVREALTADVALDLVAPRIDAQGRIEAKERITGLSGQLSVGYEDGLATAQGDSGLDSVYLGGMRAGRVRLAGFGGVRVAGVVEADASIAVDSRRELAIEAASLAAREIRLAGDSLKLAGRVEETASEENRHEESWFIWQTGAHDVGSYGRRQEVTGTRLTGDSVVLEARGKAVLEASDIRARDLRVVADQVELGSVAASTLNGSYDNAWQDSWLHRHTDETETVRVHGVRLEAGEALSVAAGAGGLGAHGAILRSAGELELVSRGGLTLDGALERDRERHEGRRRNEGAALETGSWAQQESSERVVASRVESAGGAWLSAAGDLRLEGADITSGGDLIVAAGRDLAVMPAQAKTQRSDSAEQTQWGGLAGGDTHADSDDGVKLRGATLGAGGRLGLAAGKDIHLSAATVDGRADAVALAGGDILVDNGIESTHSRLSESRAGVFSIPTASREGGSDEERALGSDLHSVSNLRLGSQGDFALIGSRAGAGGRLEIEAGGAVSIAAAAQEAHARARSSALKVGVYAREAGAEQYRAGWQVEYRRESRQDDRVEQLPSRVDGADIAIRAGSGLEVRGSHIAADGDVELAGTRVDLAASQDTARQQRTDDVIVAGAYVTAGVERVGDGLSVGQQGRTSGVETRDARVSSVAAGGALTLTAGTLRSEGAQLDAGGALRVAAAQVDNVAATSRRAAEEGERSWGAELGPSADYGELGRPLLKLGQAIAQARPEAGALNAALGKAAASVAQGDWKGAYQAVLTLLPDPSDSKVATALGDAALRAASQDWKGAYEAVSRIGIPDAGFDLAVHADRRDRHDSALVAQPTQLTGASIDVDVSGRLGDEGTRYHAQSGAVTLAAGQHDFGTAGNENRHEESADNGKAVLRVATRTGYDLLLKGLGEGAGRHDLDATRGEEAGSIVAAGGVNIAVAGDAAYRGTHIEAGGAGIDLRAGGDLTLSAARQAHEEVQDRVKGGASLNVTITENAEAGRVRASAGSTHEAAHTGSVQPGSLASPGAVTVQAGRDLSLEGGVIGEAGTGPVRLAGGRDVVLSAARGQRDSDSRNWSVEAGVGIGTGKPLDAELAVSVAQDGSTAATAQGGVIVSHDTLALSAEGGTLRVEGAALSGREVGLASAGTLTLESAQTAATQSGWSARVALSGERTPGTDETGAKVGGTVDLGVTQTARQEQHQLGTRVDGTHVVLTAPDAVLAGAEVVAQKVGGRVDGELELQGRLDGVQRSSGSLSAALEGGTPRAAVSFERSHDDTLAAPTGLSGRDGVRVEVGGGTVVVGARIESEAGAVEVGRERVADLPGRHERLAGSLDFSGAEAPAFERRSDDASVAGVIAAHDGAQR
jgi:hemolysin